MKINKYAKLVGMAGLVLTVAVGCASSPKATQSAQAQQQSAQAQAQAAIAAAKAAVAKAKNDLWVHTASILKQAEAAYAKGDYATATELANKARQQAEQAYAQAQSQMAAKKAAAAPGAYTVVRGDCLWNIAGKSAIYNNPYEWPLIYKANQAKIKDPDLIFPGQTFSITRDASQADIAAAVQHAKTRGAWSLGKVEASDKAYLAGK